MHYVKHFKINGVDTKQVACIELQGRPNTATEGSVGVLGVDMSSPTHDVYKCVAVNGSIYTWELLSSGMSIIGATIAGEGGETKAFPYDTLLTPMGYVIKIGDLILDSEGYLYQVRSMESISCNAVYTGTHIGSTGGKTCRLSVTAKGKLQLVTETGAVWSSVDTLLADGDTLHRDAATGNGVVIGVKTINDTTLKFFVGTQSEYDALADIQKQNLFALITDDTTREDLMSGEFVVGKAKHSESATELRPANGISASLSIDNNDIGRATIELEDNIAIYLVTIATDSGYEIASGVMTYRPRVLCGAKIGPYEVYLGQGADSQVRITVTTGTDGSLTEGDIITFHKLGTIS